MNERLVIDASVAAKWFLRDKSEADIDLADDILVSLLSGDVELHAPRVFIYEFCGVLSKACGTRASSQEMRLSKDRAIQCVREIFDLPIHHVEVTLAEVIGALTLAVDFAKKSYDMSYVHLAQSIDCQWCTSDGKVLKAIPKSFPRDRVLLLADRRSAP